MEIETRVNYLMARYDDPAICTYDLSKFVICYPWASSWATRKIDIDEFPNVKGWLEEIGERPAVKKAMAMEPEFREDPASISAEEQARRRKLVADQRAQSIPSEWIRAA